ncbi:MAG: hypothetical protein NTV43_16385 [Methylococcales bacterium]|nr:hypothetical protein [Methylococcales bacterium]
MNGLKTEAPQNTPDKSTSLAANISFQLNPLDDVVTIDSLQAEYPHLFTKPQLSWLLKTRHKNGLDQVGAILKISRKLYIKKSIFINWFLEQKAGNS